jgi:hypothetical protein
MGLYIDKVNGAKAQSKVRPGEGDGEGEGMQELENRASKKVVHGTREHHAVWNHNNNIDNNKYKI